MFKSLVQFNQLITIFVPMDLSSYYIHIAKANQFTIPRGEIITDNLFFEIILN